MSLRRTLILTLVLAALAPGQARADGVRVVEREEPLGAVQLGLERAAPLEFTLVGIHWQGPGEVLFRTAGADGGWSPWRPARPEDEDLPDAASSERSAAGWKIGNPWWTGESTRIQYQAVGTVTRLRAFFVSSPVTAADEARAQSAGLAAPASFGATALRVERPPIVLRKGWKADESIVRGSPVIAPRLDFAVVHHTAGTNSYSAAESAAIVRGIQRYHVVGNGWNDVGYNFLVDKYGQIFEGRKGGVGQNVVGAHAAGFNTGSVGVAVLGTYGSAQAPPAARQALQRLLAWRLDVAHVDPTSLVDAVSFGNERFKAGAKVRLRAVSGHRDTGSTSCPGNVLYGHLGTIATAARALGLPKLFDPQVSGGVGGPVRFTARLSSARAWTVQVKAGAAVVAEGSGSGTAVDWTWSSGGAPAAAYTYTIAAGEDTRPATGTIPGPAPLAVTDLAAAPAVLTPNGDWSGERTTVSFQLSRQAAVTVRIVAAATSTVVRTLFTSGARPAGNVSLSWVGGDGTGTIVPDGHYRVEVTAEAGGEVVTRSVPLTVDRTLGGVAVTPAVISPNGDGQRERLRVAFALTRPASARVEIRRKGKVVRTVMAGSLAAGSYAALWDGLNKNGKKVAEGPVNAVVVATTSLGTRQLGRPSRIDTVPPAVRILWVRRAGKVTRVRFTLSEPAEVRLWYGKARWNDGSRVVLQRKAGTHTIARSVQGGIVRIVVVDEARNASRAVLGRAG